MDTMKHLFDVFKQSLKQDTFVKLTVSKPLRKKEGAQNVYVRLFIVDGKEVFQFKYRQETDNQYQQLSLEAAIVEVERLLMESFRAATLFTLQQDLLVLISKKKLISYRENSPSFKNKLPEVPQES
jgi:hypothetical protein|tara:strand:- start:11775 stop:12152 length:378 start_codon:yes stop_codon:yes gene_type:complete